MTTELLSKEQLQARNRSVFRYPLAIAEKDYFLAVAVKILFESALKDYLVFKGGTALYHTHIDQLRFSEDLDFTATAPITLEDLSGVFSAYPFFEVKKSFVSEATVKIERLQYTGPLVQPNSIKIEIDHLQNVILPAQQMPYHNAYGVEVTARVMDIREIAAEKVRAMSDRARFRDFYDFTQIMKQPRPDIAEVLDLVRKKEIRRPITTASIMAHWDIARQDQEADVDRLYFREALSREDIERALEQLPDVRITVHE